MACLTCMPHGPSKNTYFPYKPILKLFVGEGMDRKKGKV